MRPRSPAITRRNTRPTSRCGCRTRSPNSSSSRATTARSRNLAPPASGGKQAVLLAAAAPLYPRQPESHRHVRHALDCCRSRRPDGPRADAGDCGDQGRGAGRRAGGAGFGAARQGRRRACRPAGQRHQTLRRSLAPLSKDADGILDFTVPAATSPMSRSPPSAASCTSSAPPACRPRKTR